MPIGADALKDGPFRRAFAALAGRFWLPRPALVSAGVALALVATLLFVRMSTPTVSAAELLDRTLAAEEQVAANDTTVVHRTMQLEERDARGGELIARRRIETWRSHRRGVTVRRLFDQRGKLLASEWRRADGSRTIYRVPVEGDPPAAGAFDDVWLIDPSARDFKELTGDGARARVEEERERYVVTHQSDAAGGAEGVVTARLVISRAASRATAQTLVVRRGEQTREYRFVETGFDLRPAGGVPPAAFEPDEDLLKVGVTRTSVPPPAAGAQAPAAEQRRQPALSTVTATSELEVEVLRLLNQVGADLGEQINVTRTPGGRLRVHGVVETQERRGELMRSLSALTGNSAVEVEVSTAGEALRSGASGAAGPAVVHHVGPADNHIPAEEELRRHYSKDKGMSDEEARAAILQLAGRASQRSMLALQHAWAMKRLAARFPDSELRALDASAREKWLSMMQSHARAVRRESAQLRQELQPIFPHAGGGPSGGPAVGDADGAGLARAVERLLNLCSATDRGVRMAFSASPDGAKGSALLTSPFWRDLRHAEGLASWVESEAQRMRSTQSAPRAAPAPEGAPEEK